MQASNGMRPTIGGLVFLWICLILVGGIGGYFLGMRVHERQIAPEMASLAYFKDTYLEKQGGTIWHGIGDYRLASFDGGRNWYAITKTPYKNETGEFVLNARGNHAQEVKIIGPAEEVYPGLVSYLKGFEALIEYVKEKGPMTFSEERAEQDKKVLEAAGFTVTGQ